MSKAKNKAQKPRRKIGERIEVVEIKLSPMQIESARARVIDLLQEKDELEEKLASVKADYKAKIAEVDSRKAAELGAVRSGRVRHELVIEEWVTDRNEVIRLDKVTGEEIGRRTATPRELQEELPLDSEDPELAEEIDADEQGEGDSFGEAS